MGQEQQAGYIPLSIQVLTNTDLTPSEKLLHAAATAWVGDGSLTDDLILRLSVQTGVKRGAVVRYNCTRCQQPQTLRMIGGDPLWFCSYMECERFGVMTIMADARRCDPEDFDEPTKTVSFTVSFEGVRISKLRRFMDTVMRLARDGGAINCRVDEHPTVGGE